MGITHDALRLARHVGQYGRSGRCVAGRVALRDIARTLQGKREWRGVER
jgi:hypothetical protein